MIKKIYAVWVYVKNLDESRKFYEDVVGLKFKFQDGDWIEFDLGSTSFAILKKDSAVKPQKTRIMFQVDDLGKMEARLLAQNVKLIQKRKTIYGALLTFQDPNGHWLELYEPK